MNKLFNVTPEMVQEWTPAMESYMADDFAKLPKAKQALLIGMAAKAGTELGITATESANMLAVTGDNANMAPDVANPMAGDHNGLVAQAGTPGSADRQFLVGLCIAIAAKTIGMDIVQTVQATSNNITVDYLEVVYTGGNLSNAKNENTYVITVTFAKTPVLKANEPYAFKLADSFVLAKYIKPARETRGGYIFELQSKFNAKIDGSGALTDVTQVAGTNLAEDLATATLGTIDNSNTQITAIQVDGADLTVTSIDKTKAVENYVPHQTTKGLKRTLSRSEADAGTDRDLEIEMKNDAYTIGNRTFNSHISRLQLKRLKERGIDPVPYVVAAMKNEISQEINWQIISAARAMGITNALNKQAAGISFNAYFGPQNVAAKQFDAIPFANELSDFEGNPITGKFADVPNTLKVMQYENIQSMGTAICMLIKQAAYSIGVDSRYGDADAVVVSSSIAGFISASSMFTAAGDRGLDMDSKTGAKLSGSIGDIKVYTDVNMPENCPFVTVLRTNKDVNVDVPGIDDENILVPGLAYVVKDIISTTELVPEGTAGRKVILDSETELIAIGQRPEAGYLTFAIDIAIPGLVNALP